MSENALQNLITEIAEKASAQIELRLQSIVTDLFKANLKLIYNETEAAEFLKVSVEALASWRKRRLIEFAQYPVARLRKGDESDKLGDCVTYDLAALLSFRARYVIVCASPNKFELSPNLSLVGPKILEVRSAA